MKRHAATPVPAPLGNKSELLLRPLKNIDVARRGSEGLHQLRVFLDVTPDVEPGAGVFVLLVNQQQRGSTELKPHHPAWYTGQLSRDAVPVQFIDLDKLYYALEEAKRLQEQYAETGAVGIAARIQTPVLTMPVFEARDLNDTEG